MYHFLKFVLIIIHYPFLYNYFYIIFRQTRKPLMKVFSRVWFLKCTFCLLLSICLMIWKITCIQIAAVGVQLFHCGDEKWFAIVRFKGGAAIRAKLTSLLRTPSCHLYQSSFRNHLLSFTKYVVRAELVWRYILDQRLTEFQIKHLVIFQGNDKTSSTLLLE